MEGKIVYIPTTLSFVFFLGAGLASGQCIFISRLNWKHQRSLLSNGIASEDGVPYLCPNILRISLDS